MDYVTNYTVSPEVAAETEKMLAETKEKYQLIEGIILVSAFDAGPFFAHELDEVEEE